MVKMATLEMAKKSNGKDSHRKGEQLEVGESSPLPQKKHRRTGVFKPVCSNLRTETRN